MLTRIPFRMVGALALLAVGLASCQETEEDTSQVVATEGPTASATQMASSTPTTPPGLPPPAEGYEWYVTPENGAFDYGLPLYAVQIPKTYVRTPAGPYYGNPEQFIPSATTAYSTRIIVRVTPVDALILTGFQNDLPWQGGGLCGMLEGTEVTSAVGTWRSYEFKCPETEAGYCDADDAKTTITCVSEDPGAPLPVFDGRAAETRMGTFVYSITVFRPEAREDAEAAFEQAISSFTLR